MENLEYKEIGKRIQSQRRDLKITQEKLAEIIDVSPSYISEIERGSSICSLSTIVNIASSLNVSLDFLVFGITEKILVQFLQIFLILFLLKIEIYILVCVKILHNH